MKKKILILILSFCCAQAHDKLDQETRKTIGDVYDPPACKQIKVMEKYFAFTSAAIYEDSVNLNPCEGQMEEGYMVVMTAGHPLKMRSKFGTYTFNNCSASVMEEEELTLHLQKKMGASVVGMKYADGKKTTIFEVNRFDQQKLPTPKERETRAYVRPEEARHAFLVLNQQYEDEQACSEFIAQADVSTDTQEREALVKEWQPIACRNYHADPNAPQRYRLFSLGALKAMWKNIYPW